MAVRLREADNIAAMAELQQQISELEIQVTSRHPSAPRCSVRRDMTVMSHTMRPRVRIVPRFPPFVFLPHGCVDVQLGAVGVTSVLP